MKYRIVKKQEVVNDVPGEIKYIIEHEDQSCGYIDNKPKTYWKYLRTLSLQELTELGEEINKILTN
jgi:hypothetical protein